MQTAAYQRIMILGNNGSGKSFFAEECSGITGLPPVHLDAEFWGPDWATPTEEAWRKKNIELVSKEKWIIDGMCSHGGTIELRFAAADLIVFLDVNRLVCLAGVVKRQGQERRDTAAGHHLDEKFDRRFFGFCKGIWEFPHSQRKQHIIDLHQKYPHKPFLVIHGRRNMHRLLRQWRGDGGIS